MTSIVNSPSKHKVSFMSQFTAAQLVDYLQLAKKFNNERKRLPFSAADLDSSVVESLSASLQKLHDDHGIADGPLGLKLARWADVSVAAVLAAPKAQVEEVVEVPVAVEAPVAEEPVVEPAVEAPVVEEVVEVPVAEEPVVHTKPRRTKK